MFANGLAEQGLLESVATVEVDLYGSLAATGKGHGSDKAILLGLSGETPDGVDVERIPAILEAIRRDETIALLGRRRIGFREKDHLRFRRRESLPLHPNGMRFSASDAAGSTLLAKVYYSVGGGFVVDDAASGDRRIVADSSAVRHPFRTANELLALCEREHCDIAAIMLANELTWRDEGTVRTGLLHLWSVMQACIERGCRTDGVLPGGMHVERRAARLYRALTATRAAGTEDPLVALDWVNLYALAVNEENAAGGRVVTAPTNGAAGIIPAVLQYYLRFIPAASDAGVVAFLLTAGAIGILYKENASISGAEVGCQGEVGVACSMAAGALAAVTGGNPEQVENAAEIGMEHHLGLTCDPIGGLVQIPCIERNAVASVNAINAARMAIHGTGKHYVSLDKVIATMRQTGADMNVKYKETARGGLAVNIIEC